MKRKSGIAGHAFQQLLQQLGDGPIPVEFQLPDWLKKQKSMPYTFIRRNVYVTKRIKRRAEDDGIFCSCSPSSGASAVCDKDCLCGMLLSCCSQSCNCGDLCVNKPFQYRPVKKMKLVKTEKCGSGLVTDEDIRQGDFVIEYVGEVIDDKTCEERLWKMKHCGETNFYLCEINRDMVIDATYKGNKSRFINHSCQPNTEMQKWTIEGETRIGIFATRDIRKGEELTYDYQFVQFGADQDCYCGAIECRQKLGSKPSKLKFSSSDTALQLVLCEMATSYPTAKAYLYGKDDLPNGRSDVENQFLVKQEAHILLFLTKKRAASKIVLGNLCEYGPLWIEVVSVGAALFLFQQLAGINAVVYYSTSVFRSAGIASDVAASALVGASNVFGTAIASSLMDRQGRKSLLITSFTGMATSMLLLSLSFTWKVLAPYSGTLAVLGTVLYVLSFSLGAGPVPALLLPEIFASRIRAKAVALSLGMHWISNFVIGLYFLSVVSKFGISSVYLGFAAVCSLAVLYITGNVVETKGRSLEEIERALNPAI